MAFTPTNNTAFQGTETLTNLTASGGTVALAGSTFVTVPTAAASDSSTNAASTAMVQAAIAAAQLAMRWAKSVKWATTAGPAITSRAAGTSITLGGTSWSPDGTPVANGERVLVKDAPTGTGTGSFDCGIYTVSGVGSSVVLTRPTDADAASELSNIIVYVEDGTANADRTYQQTATLANLTAASQTWQRFAMTAYSAGTGIDSTSLNSGTIAIDTTVVPRLAVANAFSAAQTVSTTASGVQLTVQTTAATGTSTLKVAAPTGGLAETLYTINGANVLDIYADATTVRIDDGGAFQLITGTQASHNVALGNSTGTLTSNASTPAYNDSSTKVATTAHVQLNKRNYTFNSTTPVTTNTTITASSQIPSADVMLVNTSGGAVTITLPAASAVNQGTPIRVKDANGSAGTNAITVQRNATPGTDTIDGASTATINTNFASLTLVSDGASKWYLV